MGGAMRTDQDGVSCLLPVCPNEAVSVRCSMRRIVPWCLFDEVIVRGLIAPGASESQISDGARDLADEMFGTRRFWHKRIVRSGVNTLEPYRSNPPDLTIADDDVVFLVFGPIFGGWEAGFGRTYVLGEDRAARRCRAGVAARSRLF
ncbi:M24 family metallopeptidase [Rhodococcus koreensis]|uniref:M24 family metallopeptidase n=1 Tax=Rhodococcus koreensis TaxID=99653 RepID=UPI0036710D3B